ncbi:MAG: hypothetical protein LC667_09560 [Thioalkalivibrio sp.]|nr:hypothetical protein [Thioalkalivibrio sp.]
MSSGTSAPGGPPAEDRSKQKSSARGWIVLAGVVTAAAILLIAFPAQRQPSLAAFWQLFVEMVSIMPAVLVIMGLFAVWIPPQELVELQFLGWRFTLARFAITVMVVAAMAFVFQAIIGARGSRARADA